MPPRNLKKKKSSDKPNTKTFDMITYDTRQRASGGVSILIRKNVPKVKSTATPTCKQLQSQQPYTKLSPFAHYISHLMTP